MSCLTCSAYQVAWCSVVPSSHTLRSNKKRESRIRICVSDDDKEGINQIFSSFLDTRSRLGALALATSCNAAGCRVYVSYLLAGKCARVSICLLSWLPR